MQQSSEGGTNYRWSTLSGILKIQLMCHDRDGGNFDTEAHTGAEIDQTVLFVSRLQP